MIFLYCLTFPRFLLWVLKRFFLLIFLFSPFLLWAQKPIIKVDLNQAGRSSSEVNELGYQSWTLTKAADCYKKFGNVEIHFSTAGEKGFHVFIFKVYVF